MMIEKNINMRIATNQTTQKIVEKHARSQFVTTWIPCYKGVGDQFPCFSTSFLTHFKV